jgi:hypothetical protein
MVASASHRHSRNHGGQAEPRTWVTRWEGTLEGDKRRKLWFDRFRRIRSAGGGGVASSKCRGLAQRSSRWGASRETTRFRRDGVRCATNRCYKCVGILVSTFVMRPEIAHRLFVIVLAFIVEMKNVVTRSVGHVIDRLWYNDSPGYPNLV